MKLVTSLIVALGVTGAFSQSEFKEVGDGHCRVGKKGRVAPNVLLQLNKDTPLTGKSGYVETLEDCMGECMLYENRPYFTGDVQSNGTVCHGIEWYPNWKAEGTVRNQHKGIDRETNCVLLNNHKGSTTKGYLIKKSTNRTPKKNNAKSRMNAVTCYGRIAFETTTPRPTPEPACPAYAGHAGYTRVGDGDCLTTGVKKETTRQITLNTLEGGLLFKACEGGCAAACVEAGDACVGFNFKPNVKVGTGPFGTWRTEADGARRPNFYSGEPNCILHGQTDSATAVTTITSSDGRSFKNTVAYSVCHSKDATEGSDNEGSGNDEDDTTGPSDDEAQDQCCAGAFEVAEEYLDAQCAPKDADGAVVEIVDPSDAAAIVELNCAPCFNYVTGMLDISQEGCDTATDASGNQCIDCVKYSDVVTLCNEAESRGFRCANDPYDGRSDDMSDGDDESNGDGGEDPCSATHDGREGATSEARCLAMPGCTYDLRNDHCGKDAEYASPVWSDTHKMVGKGDCESQKEQKKQTFDFLKLLNTKTADDCAERCVGEVYTCIGFQFKPNVDAVPGGHWRKSKPKGEPNCKLLTHTKFGKSFNQKGAKPGKGEVMSEVTSASGYPKKPTKHDFKICYSRLEVPEMPPTTPTTIPVDTEDEDDYGYGYNDGD